MEMYLLIIVSIICVGLFSGLEIAFLTVNKLKMELKIRQGDVYAKILSGFVKSPVKFISTTLLAVNVGIVMYSIAMTEVLDPWLLSVLPPKLAKSKVFVTFMQAIIETLVLLFIAEFAPKVLFKMYSESLLRFFSPLIWLVYHLLYPVIAGVTWFSKFVISKVFKVTYKEDEQVFRRTDLDLYVKETLSYQNNSNEDANVDTELFKNTLKMNEIRAKKCMMPRTEIQGVSHKITIPELQAKFEETGYSKLLVYKEDVDHIIGYINLIDLFKAPEQMNQILQPVIMVPESMYINEIFSEMQKQHCGMAVVLDEFGSTYGLITMEDILEEILGEIEDEHDDEGEIEQKITENSYLFSARLKVEDLNERYRFNLEEGDYDTLGGYILAQSGRIPELNEIIELSHASIKIVSVDRNRISVVEFVRKENEEE